jgi:hypothetical protein
MTQANNVAIESSQINSSGVLQPAGGGTGLSTGYPIATTTNLAANPVTGTPSSSNYLRGDGTWASVTGMVYPGAGIPNSTGSAWGTSYTTTGSGSVVALATSPTFVTPVLGTPTSGTLTNCTGYTYANLSGTVTTWNQNTTGNAATATTATTATNWGTYGGVPAAGTSFGTANTIGRSDANGYTFFNYINSNTTNSENPAVSQVITTNGSDNYYRKSSIASFSTYLTGTAASLNIGGNAATATTAANGGVTSIVAGTGISISGATGAVTVTNSSPATASAVAKAWALFAGTASSGSPTIYNSYNISSIVINSTGYFTINFTTSMSSANYAVTGNASGDSGTDPFITVEIFMNGGNTGSLTAPTASSFIISTGQPGYANRNPYYVSIVVHGS